MERAYKLELFERAYVFMCSCVCPIHYARLIGTIGLQTNNEEEQTKLSDHDTANDFEYPQNEENKPSSVTQEGREKGVTKYFR